MKSKEDIASSYFSSLNNATDMEFLSKRKDVIYMRYDNFDNANIAVSIKESMKSKKDISYIILDLRENYGGNELEADTLLMSFLDIDTLVTYRSITRRDNAYYAAMGYGIESYKAYYEETILDTLAAEVLIKKDLPLYTQPLIILTSEKTCSAAEDFLITLKLHYPNRAIIVGMPTAGSTGAPFVRNLYGFYYRVCTRFPITPAGMFEQGIRPDYHYERSIEEYMTGKDGIFEFVDEIMEKLNQKNNGI
ncbi:MAG: hypothetical protein LBO06_02295, partial [Bacteroidales bacterium]|jgi:C-terminal processing protease CtpA/Prc|nr:hypothetical protein [Bacteroidales bacterium]